MYPETMYRTNTAFVELSLSGFQQKTFSTFRQVFLMLLCPDPLAIAQPKTAAIDPHTNNIQPKLWNRVINEFTHARLNNVGFLRSSTETL